MEQIRNLPIATRILIAVGVGGVLLFGAFMLFLKGDGSEVVATYDSEVAALQARSSLKDAGGAGTIGGIAATINEADGRYQVRVAPEMATEARGFLRVDTNNNDKTIKTCKEPSTLGSTAQKQVYQACLEERKIEAHLKATPGISDAYVNITRAETTGILAAKDNVKAAVTLYLNEETSMTMTGTDLAKGVAASNASLTTEDIFIKAVTSDTEEVLWRGGTPTETSGAAASCTPTGETTLSDLTMCLNEQTEQDITSDIVNIIPASSSVQVSVNTVLTSTAETKTVSEVVSDSGNLGATQTLQEITSQPGAVAYQKISIYLTDVDRETQQTIRMAVNNLIDTERGDRAEVYPVKSAAEGGDGTAEAGSEAADGASDEAATAKTTVSAEDQAAMADNSLRTMLMLAGIALAGFAALAFTTWQRNRKLTQERQLFEQEFAHDISRFQTVAAMQPDDLAGEIEEFLATTPANNQN